MEENTNKKEKKIDTGLWLAILLIVLVLALIFILVGQNTNLIYKKVKDENMSIKVPVSFNVVRENDYSNADKDEFIVFYYIHKDYGLSQEELMEIAYYINKKEHLRSEIYSKEIDGYNALQRHYNYEKIIDHNHYYMAGLVTLIELEDRFLVIDMYSTLVRGEGEVMDFEDIQLELFNEILGTLKIEDNTSQMPEAADVLYAFHDLEFELPEYWSEHGSMLENIIWLEDSDTSATMRIEYIGDEKDAINEDVFNNAKKPDNSDRYYNIGSYTLDGIVFEIYYDDVWEDINCVSDDYLIEISLHEYSSTYKNSQKTQQAMIDMLFGN